jgi:hypothetical protein
LQQSRSLRVAYVAGVNVHSFSLEGASPSFNLQAAEFVRELAPGWLAGVTISPNQQLAISN